MTVRIVFFRAGISQKKLIFDSCYHVEQNDKLAEQSQLEELTKPFGNYTDCPKIEEALPIEVVSTDIRDLFHKFYKYQNKR